MPVGNHTNPSLVTDLYELTMMQGYLRAGLNKREACFDLFCRKNPFKGGYAIAAGLEDALGFLESIRFSGEDIRYLESVKLFDKDFLEYLKNFRFTADVYAIREGTPVFPMEPILRVQGPLDQCQFAESGLLNIINFQSLIATKSARVCREAGKDNVNVFEFGLRRAQGDVGALSASRAAYIGGCAATSNVAAGKMFGIPVGGTHAHSWVMAFESELEAFRNYVENYPENSILLIDTYNTLKSGMPNAIKVGLEMKQRGEKLKGVRLDSGDLAYLSREVRTMLDEAGLKESLIVCSGELDEYVIHDLESQGARIDVYGVGTKLVTGDGDPALSGVYKLAAQRSEVGEWEFTLEISDSAQKSTLPCIKQVWRMLDETGGMMADIIEVDGENPDFSKGVFGDGIKNVEPLLTLVMSKGEIKKKLPTLKEIRERARVELDKLHPAIKRLVNPHEYKVSLGPRLTKETRRLLNQSR
ncbi:MAG: nicotinate phosphoribosyltransferase [bacterium]|nr:MAG: nicotinate phosphoribosyltransferase [bacterium]